ncbi:hypothetical protein ABZT34_31840 [Streptomyces sp. NPDC005329]|uniref:hypothetical protein n=1 Tax=Streptomyces sp. NPDC005329 TaxID=3157034 RepID=UPI0033AA9704
MNVTVGRQPYAVPASLKGIDLNPVSRRGRPDRDAGAGAVIDDLGAVRRRRSRPDRPVAGYATNDAAEAVAL